MLQLSVITYHVKDWAHYSLLFVEIYFQVINSVEMEITTDTIRWRLLVVVVGWVVGG